MKKKNVIPFKEKGIIHLEDLVPLEDVMGRSGKVLFGERFDQKRVYHMVRERELKKRNRKSSHGS